MGDTSRYFKAISLDSAFLPILGLASMWMLYDFFFLPWGHWGHLAPLAFFILGVVGTLVDLAKANSFPQELIQEVVARAPRDDALSGGRCWTLRERIDFCNFVQLSCHE